MYEYECINMCDLRCYWEGLGIYVHTLTHVKDELVSKGALKGVPKNTLKVDRCSNMLQAYGRKYPKLMSYEKDNNGFLNKGNLAQN